MFSQRIFKGASRNDDEPKNILTMKLSSVAHDHLMYVMHVLSYSVVESEMLV